MNDQSVYQSCPNNKCLVYQKTGNYITIHDKTKNRFRCKLCGKTWVGNFGTFFYGLRASKIKVDRAIQMLRAGISIRYIARLTKVSPSSVMRWKKKLKVNHHSL